MITGSRQFSELPPLGLYVHIPWCISKCPYCDFNSHEQRDELPEDDYVDALLADLADEMPSVWGRTLSSVFIGGGTPSLFSARALDKLISGIRALTALAPDVELTLEANPGTAEQQRFSEYRALGING
jgi:oxygen-independent coproporphyrinogen-3 oxidase